MTMFSPGFYRFIKGFSSPDFSPVVFVVTH